MVMLGISYVIYSCWPQSPSHRFGRVLHCDISGRAVVVKGVGAVCGESFAAAKKSGFGFLACNHSDWQKRQLPRRLRDVGFFGV